MNDETRDLLAQMNAEMQQAQAAAVHIASLMGTYYRAFLEEGFEPDQAIALTSNLFGPRMAR